MKFALASVFLAFAGLANAQSCGNLAVTGTTTLQFAASNLAANAPAVLMIGPSTGTTTFNLGPIGTLTLGLAAPFVPVMLGATSATGGATLSIDVPSTVPPTSLHAQAFSIDGGGRPPRIDFCTTNVVSFSIGS